MTYWIWQVEEEEISQVQAEFQQISNKFEEAVGADGRSDGAALPAANVQQVVRGGRSAVKKSRSFDSGSNPPHPPLGYVGRAGSFQPESQTDTSWLTDAIEPEMAHLQMVINSLNQVDKPVVNGEGKSVKWRKAAEADDPLMCDSLSADPLALSFL